jgi:hypothetical protein
MRALVFRPDEWPIHRYLDVTVDEHREFSTRAMALFEASEAADAVFARLPEPPTDEATSTRGYEIAVEYLDVLAGTETTRERVFGVRFDDEIEIETAWHASASSEELANAFAEAGFEVVRPATLLRPDAPHVLARSEELAAISREPEAWNEVDRAIARRQFQIAATTVIQHVDFDTELGGDRAGQLIEVLVQGGITRADVSSALLSVPARAYSSHDLVLAAEAVDSTTSFHARIGRLAVAERAALFGRWHRYRWPRLDRAIATIESYLRS